jgi:hypothetical protein
MRSGGLTPGWTDRVGSQKERASGSSRNLRADAGPARIAVLIGRATGFRHSCGAGQAGPVAQQRHRTASALPDVAADRASSDPDSRADVADFLVKQIDNDAFLHKTPVLTS